MEDIAYLLGQFLGIILLGFIIEGLVLLPFELYKWFSKKMRKTVNHLPKFKARKNFTYYFANVLKYLVIGIPFRSLEFFTPLEEHTLSILIIFIISGAVAFFLNKFCNSLKTEYAN